MKHIQLRIKQFNTLAVLSTLLLVTTFLSNTVQALKQRDGGVILTHRGQTFSSTAESYRNYIRCCAKFYVRCRERCGTFIDHQQVDSLVFVHLRTISYPRAWELKPVDY